MTMSRGSCLGLGLTTRRGQCRFWIGCVGNDDDDDHRVRNRFRSDREDGDDDMDLGDMTYEGLRFLVLLLGA